jgi:glyoxylase-like metal-dependent hydrolase (beta-lactamase superfamily II)
MTDDGIWEAFAVRYATHATRTRRESFMGLDPHDASPNPLDYYVWVLRNGPRVVLVDTGFDQAEAARRGRPIIRLPCHGLAMLGIDAAAIEDVIITHLHYDHAGTIDGFPDARFFLQEAEMAYATGRCMTYEHLRLPYSADHVCQLVQKVFAGRVAFVGGDRELAPGLSVHLIGGHAKGVQAVRVRTRRGWIVLASDSSHYYENFLTYRPFIITLDVEATLRGFDRLRDLAESPDHIIPGHDPLVMRRYPAPEPHLADIIARLDVPPRAPL